MSERPSFIPLEQLQKKAKGYQKALGQKETILANLKSNQVPAGINPLTALDPRETIRRIRRLGEITGRYQQSTIPAMEERLKKTEETISQISTVAEEISQIRQLQTQGYLSAEQMALAEANLFSLLGKTPTEQETKALTLPVETKQPPLEAPTPEEKEKRPAKITLVDPKKKIFLVDDKKVTFKDGINWRLLVLAAKINDPNRTYTSDQLKKIAIALGAAVVPGVGSQAFNNLKNSIANSVSGARSDFFERTEEEGESKYKINATFEGFEKISFRAVEQLLKELGVTKRFGSEPVSEVVFNVLNHMVNNPDLTVEQAIELRGPRSDNRPFNTSQLIMSLNSAVNVLVVRSREGTLTEQEKALVELICSRFEEAEVTDSLKSFRKNIFHWVKEGAPILPAQEPGGPSRKDPREKITIVMPDGTELETHGKQGKGLQYLVVLAANEGSFCVRGFAKDIYGTDTSSSLQAAKSLLRQIKKLLISSGWEVDIPQDLKDVDKILTVSVVKTLEQPSAHAEKIAELQKSLQALVEHRESFREAVGLNLPGPYSQELEGVNREIANIEAQIDELKQN